MDDERARRAFQEFLEALELPAGEVDAVASAGAVVSAYRDDLLRGYASDPRDFLKVELESAAGELVMLRDVPFVSLCAHHMVPFHGVAHVGYLPLGQLTGLSSIARLVDGYACRLQSQERLARSIANALTERLHARGAACRIEATQLCVEGRATRKPGIRAVSEFLTGAFHDEPAERARWNALLGSAPQSRDQP